MSSREKHSDNTILLAVAPNGARRTKKDHPRLPIITAELIETAHSCLLAGAGMMHFHIRDGHGKHCLDPQQYLKVIDELTAAVGDELLLQVSSEAAGIYNQDQQIALMNSLAPHCVSCGLREFIGTEDDFEKGSSFFAKLAASGTLVQYILYSPDDVEWFVSLCRQGVLPERHHFLLFVIGRHDSGEAVLPGTLSSFLHPLAHHPDSFNWMVCGFGENEHMAAAEAVAKGGHVRVGFENNLCRPDGSLAADNRELVLGVQAMAVKYGRRPGGKLFAESLYGR